MRKCPAKRKLQQKKFQRGGPEAELVKAMSNDEQLTPEAVSELMCDPALNVCLEHTTRLEDLVASDVLFLNTIQELSKGLVSTNSLVSSGVLRRCADANLRANILGQKRVVDATSQRAGLVKTSFAPTQEHIAAMLEEPELSRRSLAAITIIVEDRNHPLRAQLREALTERQKKNIPAEKDFLSKTIPRLR